MKVRNAPGVLLMLVGLAFAWVGFALTEAGEMLALGVPELTARTIYNAVSEFGQHAFDEDRAAQGMGP